jgi:hypothetical protein
MMSLVWFVSLVVLSDALLPDVFDPRLAQLSGCWRMDDTTQGLRFEFNFGSFPSHIVFNSWFPINSSRVYEDLVYVLGDVSISSSTDELRLHVFTLFRPWPVGAVWRFETWNSTHMSGGEDDGTGRSYRHPLSFGRASARFCMPWQQPALPGAPLREESVSLVSMLSGCWRADEPNYASEHDFGVFPSSFIATTYTNLATRQPEASLPLFELWAVLNITIEDVGLEKHLLILMWNDDEFALAVFSTWNSTNMLGTLKRTLMSDPVPLNFERKPLLACGGAQLETTRTLTVANKTVTKAPLSTTKTTISTKEPTSATKEPTTLPLSLPSSTAAAPADFALIGGVAGGVGLALCLGAGIAGFFVWRRKRRAAETEASTSTTPSSPASPYGQLPALSDIDRVRATPEYGDGRLDL